MDAKSGLSRLLQAIKRTKSLSYNPPAATFRRAIRKEREKNES
jgi:hypothetical protein